MSFYLTEGCRAHGHPEFTVVCTEPPVPGAGVEHSLPAYLEHAVAEGERFRPGDTMQFGWRTVRVTERPDGTLGLEERVEEGWREQVDQTLRDAWYQNAVAESVGLEPVAPFEDDTMVVSECGLDAPILVLSRSEAGWAVVCMQDDPDADTLEMHVHYASFETTLSEFTRMAPFSTQFLALPAPITVCVVPPHRTKTGRIEAHVVHESYGLLTPAPDSYLATLNADRTPFA